VNLFDVYRELPTPPAGKIVLIVFDGLGGLPREPGGPTELEAAATPNLDALAADGSCGLLDNVLPGVTPGSGPAHLGLFGYDPLVYDIGRGLLSALGIGFPVEVGDLCARINFCTLHPDTDIVLDRRAGRIPTDESGPLVELLGEIQIPGCEIFIESVKEHRACVVFRAPDLYDDIDDTDPQTVWEDTPLAIEARQARSEKAAGLVADFARQATEKLKARFAPMADALRGPRAQVEAFITENHPANGILLRGFARYEKLPHLGEVFGIRSAAIATYPMYRGVASLVGMAVLDDAGETSTTCSSSTSRRPTATARTGTGTGRCTSSRRGTRRSPVPARWAPRWCASRPTTRPHACSKPIAGIPCPSCCGRSGVAATASRPSARRPAPAAASADSAAST